MTCIVQPPRTIARYAISDYYAFPKTSALNDFIDVMEETYPEFKTYPHAEMAHFGCLDAPLP